MRDELAGQLLDVLLGWSDEERAEWIEHLRRMAAHKYDGYEGYTAGERFFERLARWLSQFEDIDDRHRLLTFVMNDLVFISRDELNHAIATVYPDVIKPELARSVAHDLGLEWWRLRQVMSSREFRSARRKTLYLGLSDGARLDQLRRASPELSHEQFWLAPELGDHGREGMVEKLGEAIEKQDLRGPPIFERLVLIDDFYGSGTSLISGSPEEGFRGKLPRARQHIHELQEGGVVIDAPHVTVVIYIASAQAEQHIARTVEQFEPNWKIHVVQRLPKSLRVDDDDMVAMCEWFFDAALTDEHKKGPVPLGYKDAALPLVIHHNTPNNSISLLWADTSNVPGSDYRHALFPRYERHHVDRP